MSVYLKTPNDTTKWWYCEASETIAVYVILTTNNRGILKYHTLNYNDPILIADLDVIADCIEEKFPVYATLSQSLRDYKKSNP